MVIASEFRGGGHIGMRQKKTGGRPSKVGQEMLRSVSGPLLHGRWTLAVLVLGWLGADQTRRPKPYERQNRHVGCTGRWFEDVGRLQLVQFDGLRETVAFQIPPSHGPLAAGDVLRKGCVF